MGRRAKYLTVEERKNAVEEARKKYLLTEKAKVARSAQNHRAYVKRTISEPGNTALQLPAIPRAVRNSAALPIPTTSALFIRIFRSTEEITEDDDYAHWESHPPYSVSPELVKFGLEETSEALHGRRHRIQYEYETARLHRYKKAPIDTFQAEVHAEILQSLSAWQNLHALLKGFRASYVDITMGKHLLQWKARHLVNLVEDWKALKHGKNDDKFMSLYIARWC